MGKHPGGICREEILRGLQRQRYKCKPRERTSDDTYAVQRLQPGRRMPAGALSRPSFDRWRRRACQGHPFSLKIPIWYQYTLAQHLVHAARNSKSTLKLRLRNRSGEHADSIKVFQVDLFCSLRDTVITIVLLNLDETRRASARRACRSPPPLTLLLAPRMF
jgi:hypothetical protein